MMRALSIAVSASLTFHGMPTEAQGCGSQPPGYGFFTGYDLSNTDLLNLENLNEKLYALNNTCNSGITYVNEYDNETYYLPDQLDGVPLNIGGDMTRSSSILVSNSFDFREQVAAIGGLSVFFGLFSASAGISEALEFLTNQSLYAGVRSTHLSTYRMILHPAYRTDVMGLSQDCQGLVDALPPQFDVSSFAAYEKVIKSCGTDYMQEAILGCKLQYRHFTGTGKLDIMAEVDVQENAELDFLGFLKKSGAKTGDVKAASDNYLEITVSETDCFGASAQCPLDVGSFNSWVSACPTAPVVLEANFAPLMSLVRDPDKAASFALARTNHFNLAFLRDEFIPLCTLILTILDGPLPINDTNPGTSCGAPTVCPPGGTSCDSSTFWKCKCDGRPHGCGEYGNFSCPNPTFGDDVNGTATKVLANIAAWKSNITALVASASTAVKGSIVTNATVTSMGNQFVYFMQGVQRALARQSCGWTFNQYETPCTGCNPAQGPLANTNITRNLTYMPALA